MDIGKRQTVRKGNWEMGYWEKGKLENQEKQETSWGLSRPSSAQTGTRLHFN